MELKDSVANLVEINEKLKLQIENFNTAFKNLLTFIHSIT